MRISSINQWSQCEAKALRAPTTPYRQSAAALVGTAAHAALAGLPSPELPRRVSWDQTTPSAFHLWKQAQAIADTGGEALDRDGWFVDEYEEFVFDDENTGTRRHHCKALQIMAQAIIDLKTGRSVGGGWLQVGGYALLASLAGHDIKTVGILHVPRVKLGVEPKAALTLRPVKGVAQAYEAQLLRVKAIVEQGAAATYSPGDHCGWCRVDCAVRAKEPRR